MVGYIHVINVLSAFTPGLVSKYSFIESIEYNNFRHLRHFRHFFRGRILGKQ